MPIERVKTHDSDESSISFMDDNSSSINDGERKDANGNNLG
jgi:hypothetical protein